MFTHGFNWLWQVKLFFIKFNLGFFLKPVDDILASNGTEQFPALTGFGLKGQGQTVQLGSKLTGGRLISRRLFLLACPFLLQFLYIPRRCFDRQFLGNKNYERNPRSPLLTRLFSLAP